jgi:hypothetical protein
MRLPTDGFGKDRVSHRLGVVNWGEIAEWLLKFVGGASVLVALAQSVASLSRASRLRRRISSTLEILAALPANSPSRPLLDSLLAREVRDLCALSDPDSAAERARWRRREAHAGRLGVVVMVAALVLAKARPDLNVLSWVPIVSVPLFAYLAHAAGQQVTVDSEAQDKAKP